MQLPTFVLKGPMQEFLFPGVQEEPVPFLHFHLDLPESQQPQGQATYCFDHGGTPSCAGWSREASR